MKRRPGAPCLASFTRHGIPKRFILFRENHHDIARHAFVVRKELSFRATRGILVCRPQLRPLLVAASLNRQPRLFQQIPSLAILSILLPFTVRRKVQRAIRHPHHFKWDDVPVINRDQQNRKIIHRPRHILRSLRSHHIQAVPLPTPLKNRGLHLHPLYPRLVSHSRILHAHVISPPCPNGLDTSSLAPPPSSGNKFRPLSPLLASLQLSPASPSLDKKIRRARVPHVSHLCETWDSESIHSFLGSNHQHDIGRHAFHSKKKLSFRVVKPVSCSKCHASWYGAYFWCLFSGVKLREQFIPPITSNGMMY